MKNIPAEIIDFVLDDYQDNVWYNGDEPACPLEDLVQYWDRYVSDCATWGNPVPEGLTPELYHQIWSSEYTLRTSGTN